MSAVLKNFQKDHVGIMVRIIDDTADKILKAPASRHTIAIAQGSVLLEAPTGSGKTLTISQVLVATRAGVPTKAFDKRKVVWFWFAPFSDLVEQTIAAIRAETDLTVRDPREDRDFTTTQAGDVFVSTWQSVAQRERTSRALKMRKDIENMSSLDTMIGELRDEGYLIGAVIDEAHHNFNTAPQARSFYIDVVRPDVTIMATATPNDDDLKQFLRFAGISKLNRLSVSRQTVVDADLNKLGVKAFYFKALETDAALIDYDEIAIYCGVERHKQIKEELRVQGISCTPLLLVQVENHQASVDRARATLLKAGLDSSAIGVHTSAEPDKDLRAIAYDESKEALIFKMAVATGFDAPRAWTLVSLRSSLSASFGLQVIGRIMRVHRKLQGRLLKDNKLLDYGHVFLADAAGQSGLQGAANQLKAIVTEIKSVTDDVSIVEVNTNRFVLTDPDGGFTEILFPQSEVASDGTATLLPLVERNVDFAGALFALSDTTGPESTSVEFGSRSTESKNKDPYVYPLRTDIAIPLQLMRESMPADVSGLEECIAQRIRFDESVINLILRPKGSVRVTEEDLFEGASIEFNRKFAFSKEKAEAAAQIALGFNDSLDPRELKRLLVNRLRADLVTGGYEDQPDDVLRRTVDIALYVNPDLFKDACKECRSLKIESHRAEPIPGFLGAKIPLKPALRSVYPVFAEMNDWEYRFAELIDKESTGTILWWMRNVHNTKWACRIVRPNGQFFFPDFIIGVNGRKKIDGIALAEVKERIESIDSSEKTRVEHRDYGTALMVTWDEEKKLWYVVDYNSAIDRNSLIRRFEVSEFQLLR